MWAAINAAAAGDATYQVLLTLRERSPVVIAFVINKNPDMICLAHSPHENPQLARERPRRTGLVDVWIRACLDPSVYLLVRARVRVTERWQLH